MNTRPVTELERIEAAAYLRYSKTHSKDDMLEWQHTWFKLTGGHPTTATDRCRSCGLPMTGRTRADGCRACGSMK